MEAEDELEKAIDKAIIDGSISRFGCRVIAKGYANKIAESKLQALKKQIKAIPSKNIRMQVAWDYPGYEESKEFIPKDIVLNLINNPDSDE